MVLEWLRTLLGTLIGTQKSLQVISLSLPPNTHRELSAFDVILSKAKWISQAHLVLVLFDPHRVPGRDYNWRLHMTPEIARRDIPNLIERGGGFHSLLNVGERLLKSSVFCIKQTIQDVRRD